MSRLSATTALEPPGPRSLAIVVNRCARSISRFFMDVKGRGGCVHEQDSQTWQFQVIITNSPHTVVPYELRNHATLLNSRPSMVFTMSIFQKLREYSGPTGNQ